MKILTTVKRVTDYEAKLKIHADGTRLDLAGMNMIANPFDQIAVEEALRLKEKHGGEVIVVSVGTPDAAQQIRAAMAMGADRGVLVTTTKDLDCMAIAMVLDAVVREEKPDLVLMGKQAVDDDSHQVSEMLAEMLSWGQATQANTVTIENGAAVVAREADGGIETLSVKMPCIVTTDLRLNEPRYASLPGIMKAKSKPLAEKKAEDMGLDLTPRMVVKNLAFPPKKAGGEMVPDVATLFNKLHNEAKVL
jgi:electron transfer flavoprotein beta subunit